MTLPARRHHLALVDYLPAGLEGLNTALTGTRDMRDTGLDNRSWPGGRHHWYEHQQMRDERVEAFATELEPGQYHYKYIALATTPGTFIAPPAQAEEMYQPEIFGRTATEKVIIE